jgi:hypothetical protein
MDWQTITLCLNERFRFSSPSKNTPAFYVEQSLIYRLRFKKAEHGSVLRCNFVTARQAASRRFIL